MKQTIHFFDHCPHGLNGDRKSRYGAETTCEPCIARMLDRGLLSEVDAKSMRYFIALDDRREWEDEQAAEWAAIADGERAMAEMGLLR